MQLKDLVTEDADKKKTLSTENFRDFVGQTQKVLDSEIDLQLGSQLNHNSKNLIDTQKKLDQLRRKIDRKSPVHGVVVHEVDKIL